MVTLFVIEDKLCHFRASKRVQLPEYVNMGWHVWEGFSDPFFSRSNVEDLLAHSAQSLIVLDPATTNQFQSSTFDKSLDKVPLARVVVIVHLKKAYLGPHKSFSRI